MYVCILHLHKSQDSNLTFDYIGMSSPTVSTFYYKGKNVQEP